MRRSHHLSKFLAFGVLAVCLGGCAMFDGRESPGEFVDDTTITSKVKSNIFGDPALKVLQINVETMQGVVQLSGFVDSRRSESKAVHLARQVDGVKSVKDDLIVR